MYAEITLISITRAAVINIDGGGVKEKRVNSRPVLIKMPQPP